MTVNALRDQTRRLEGDITRLEEARKRLEGDKKRLVDRKEQLNNILIRQCAQRTQNPKTSRPEGEGDLRCDKHGY